jgi:interferon gamma-inducible protein 30/cytochrome c oxidase assembly factor 7
MKVLAYLAVLVASIGIVAPAATQAKLKVSVYYETLCPDSIRFITTQLYPAYKELPEYLELDFVPYGFADITSAPNGTFSFSCHHGDEECYGNKVHACAIAQLEKEAADAFVNCSMNQTNPPRAGQLCSDLLNVSFAPIEACAEAETGSLLLVENGIRTQTLEPSMYWVPWMTYDDVFYPEDLDPSQTNILPVLCKHLTGDKPEQCNDV